MWRKISRASTDSRTLLPTQVFNRPIHAKSDLEPRWTRYIITPGLLCTTIINLLQIAGQRGHWTITGGSAPTINDNPSTFSAILQVIASLLRAIYMYTVCMPINWTSRVILGRRPVSLRILQLGEKHMGKMCAVPSKSGKYQRITPFRDSWQTLKVIVPRFLVS
jgi:hypothetical protein